MNTKTKLLVVLVGLCVSANASAQTSWSDRVKYEPDQAIYSRNEFSLDVFGAYASRNKYGDDISAWGPGVGVNYFLTENFGFGADTYADAFNWPYMLNTTAIFRYPIGKTGFAPYAYVGFGRQWSHATQWFADMAGGIEFRFNPRTGFFTDLRGMFPGETDNYLLWRFGFRFAF